MYFVWENKLEASTYLLSQVELLSGQRFPPAVCETVSQQVYTEIK